MSSCYILCSEIQIEVNQLAVIYGTKGSLEMIMKYMYMALSTLIGLDIWIDEGRRMDMCSICSVEKLFG
jgi:hypothetical protein